MRETAETIPGQSTSNLVAKARELNLFVVFGMTEKDAAGLLYNANVFLGPDEVIGKHRKTRFIGNDALIWRLGTGSALKCGRMETIPALFWRAKVQICWSPPRLGGVPHRTDTTSLRCKMPCYPSVGTSSVSRLAPSAMCRFTATAAWLIPRARSSVTPAQVRAS